MKIPHVHSLRRLSAGLLGLILLCLPLAAFGKRRVPAGGRLAVVVDERLSALRTTPELNGVLLRRVGRGRLLPSGARRGIAREWFSTASTSPAGPVAGYNVRHSFLQPAPATMPGYSV